jgi:AraC-like DNA-binding protein
MDSVAFQGNAGDLDRFARDVLKYSATIDAPSSFERRMRWDMAGSAGFGTTMHLRSDIKLSATKISWQDRWAFQFSEAPTPLKFMLGRGAAPRLTSADGTSHAMAAGVLQVRHAVRPLNSTCEFLGGGGEFEQLALEVKPERLKELLGTPALPLVLERLLTGGGPVERHEQPLVPAMSRFLDEFLHADGGGVSRSLFLEAKGLELVAVMMDELALASDALSPLTVRDVEALQRARRLLLEHMASPPGLPALARAVALNEFKLKAGFRTLFGASVFGYLRVQRMERARRLLLAQRELSVIEIAARVGYQNPSKFSAAFRKHFGLPPSALR